jgi:hypothetical protein
MKVNLFTGIKMMSDFTSMYVDVILRFEIVNIYFLGHNPCQVITTERKAKGKAIPVTGHEGP